ncbi:MAG: rhodanese-like domain-containing protein [Anaerolineae bacterium]
MATEIPETNKTTLGLYVTPKEAFAMWEANPEGVQVLDVRTFEEYTFVGHLEMAHNVPFVFPKYDPKGPSMPGRPPGCYGEVNPEFVSTVKALYAPTETILAYCATGGRAAMAINALAQAGFTHVYNIVTGLEGDRVNDPGSVFYGKHMRNGWKNAGLPWGYGFHPDLMYVATNHAVSIHGTGGHQ